MPMTTVTERGGVDLGAFFSGVDFVL